MPLKSATSSPSSPVTRTRQVDSLWVRKSSSAVAVSRPERTALNQVTSTCVPTATTPWELQASEMARLNRQLRLAEAGADLDNPDSALAREAVAFEKLRHPLAVLPV